MWYGRDRDSVVMTVGGNVAGPGYTGTRGNPIEGDHERVVAEIVAMRDLGFKHFIAGLDPCTPAAIERFAKVIELLDRG